MSYRQKIIESLSDKFTGEWGKECLDKKGAKVLRTTNFTNEGKIDYSNIVVREIETNIIEKKKLLYGDIIIEKSGGSPNQPVGRVVFFDREDNDVYLCNNFTAILRANKQVYHKFLFYSLFYNHLIGKTLKYQNKTTGIINLKLENYLNEKILIPDLNQQQRIVAILDKADALRKKRKQALALLDEFLRSTFLEMFGDVVKNSKNFKKERFDSVMESRLGKMLDSKQQTGKHLKPYIRNTNVQWNRIDLTELLEMDFNEKDQIEFRLRFGDVLICEGGEVGRTAIWKNNLEECYFQKAIHRVRPNLKKILPEYIVQIMWFYANYGGFKDFVTSATIAHLTGIKLKSLKIPIPPIDLQIQFAKIVEQTEATKTKMQQSLQEMDNQFQALMQRAFKGEL